MHSNLKATSSVANVREKPAFGARYLTEDADVWSQNAWDHVEPPQERLMYVEKSLERQRAGPVPTKEHYKYNDKPWKHWDEFYKTNTSNFFKDRKWLQLEFPDLSTIVGKDAGEIRVLEVGCGAGNSVFPILAANENEKLKLYACDYSYRAISLVKAHPLFLAPPVGSLEASRWDLTSDEMPEGISDGSLDIVIMVFVLSALHPSEWAKAVQNVYKLLKPGGKALFRDYGRHDLTQVRFKEGRLLQENFYIRGDKTRVYFFDLDDLSMIFTGSPLPPDAAEQTSDLSHPDAVHLSNSVIATSVRNPVKAEDATHIHLFRTESIGVDRRLIVNRKRHLKMYRVWMQAQFVKIREPL